MTTQPREKIIVGLSGGVDSAVAALTLVESGADVEALFMFNWDEDETGRCQAAADFDDAAAVCRQLDIPLHRADFSANYKARVFSYFLDRLQAGRTPNPDVLCNREIKFGVFFDYALRLGADRVATGHYARVGSADAEPALFRGRDPGKDQSYFLAAMPRTTLARTLFPLGDMVKSEVRERARSAGFDVHAKPDSTGVCFIGERDFEGFLRNYLNTDPGPIRVSGGALDGQLIGEHRGLHAYTVGQRRGLGLGGVAGAQPSPWFVADKTVADNTLWVTQEPDHPRLTATQLTTSACDWLIDAPTRAFKCTAQVRYRQAAVACRVEPLANNALNVTFDRPPGSIAEGQYVVFYDHERCLGAAEIEHVETDTTPGRATV
ncbi:tRNA 2-thiouridine(34) synthase MnmA [Salinisphaera sp. USBA-960]|nr:tRNA 2-thiouridine(34) synthase MnmA [Salifodinibacter halophilus]NNC25693.1 tRNA 2-thiouridine(34) synthase MnmA [Salifodinibacter halophilus]